jgi:hypothetical protein
MAMTCGWRLIISRILLANLEAKMVILGYARVSTQDQDLSGQLQALKAAGATTTYREKIIRRPD